MNIWNRFEYLTYFYLCFYLVQCQSRSSLSPTAEPALDPTIDPTSDVLMWNTETENVVLVEQQDPKAPISNQIDKFLRSILPWTLEVDYIFISIIGLLLMCLCCCCCCQYRLCLENKKLKKDVEYAKDKRELKIVRPGTPSDYTFEIKGFPSTNNLSVKSDDYFFDDGDNRLNRFFPMFQPRKPSIIKDEK
eukprot:UN00102